MVDETRNVGIGGPGTGILLSHREARPVSVFIPNLRSSASSADKNPSMKTRVSKIARLPYQTREALNVRLLNGELGAPLLQWLNELPTTKTLLNDLFGGSLITKQNLSE